MNGARSTYMRKGYLLTALAAAVLLAASSGTAWAQGVGFATSSGTVDEKATAADDTPAELEVRVRATGLLTGAKRTPESVDTAIGKIELAVPSGLMVTYPTGSVVKDLNFDEADELVLKVRPDKEDDNWLDETFVLKLTTSLDTVSPNPGAFTVTEADDEVAPTVKFSRTNIEVTEDSETKVKVSLVKSTQTGDIPGGAKDVPNALKVMVSPADVAAFGPSAKCDDDKDTIAVLITGTEVGALDTKGMATLAKKLGALVATPAELTITACGDMSGYRDTEVTLTFDPKSLEDKTNGNVTAGAPLAIRILSDEPAPTVSFATTSVLIDEGMTNTVAILADGKQGAEVGSLNVEVSGDAMISLWQGEDMLDPNADGSYTVSLGDSANTILTIKADSDPALEDGMTSTATIKIMSASGASIGGRNSVMVTVNGSTAVPALPLVGQLLLALFLMAGGARLYRRRQG